MFVTSIVRHLSFVPSEIFIFSSSSDDIFNAWLTCDYKSWIPLNVWSWFLLKNIRGIQFDPRHVQLTPYQFSRKWLLWYPCEKTTFWKYLDKSWTIDVIELIHTIDICYYYFLIKICGNKIINLAYLTYIIQ